jgi:hypothetical protein
MNPSNSIKLLAAIAMLASLAVTIYPLNNSAYGQNREYESAHEYNSNNGYSNDNGYYKDENKYKKTFLSFLLPNA